MWQLLELGDKVLGRCDDSSGMIGDIFREAFCHNGHGVSDDVIQQLAEPLGPVGLEALKRQFQQLGEQLVPPREEWQQVSYGSGGPTYAHEPEESSRQLIVMLLPTHLWAPRKIRVPRGSTSETHCGNWSVWSLRPRQGKLFEVPLWLTVYL